MKNVILNFQCEIRVALVMYRGLNCHVGVKWVYQKSCLFFTGDEEVARLNQNNKVS